MDPSSIDTQLGRLRFVVHGLSAVALAVAILLAWWVLIRPLKLQQAVAAQRMSQLMTTLASADAIQTEHVRLREQLAAAQKREALLQARVPDYASEEDFLALATELAAESCLNIKDYRPGKRNGGPSCSSLEVHVIAEGDYRSICCFFDGMEKLPRQSSITGLRIDSSKSQEAYVVEMTVLLYFGAIQEPAQSKKGAPHA